jgi:hypothetical protein
MMRDEAAIMRDEAAEAEYWARLYGRWQPLTLPQATDFLAGFDRPWWVVGGWSIDAFTGVAREHSDVDISILSGDVPALRAFLAGRFHLWNLYRGDMRPLTDQHPEVFAPDSQLWIREHGDAPWLLDVPLTPQVDGRWSNKFLPGHTAPLAEVSEVRGGVRYLRPEITLFFKARSRRTKDERDLEVALPLLDGRQKAWLSGAIATAWGPEHPWRERI